MILSIIFDIWLLLKIVAIILPVIAIIDILKRKLLGLDKLIWILLVAFIPVIGSIIYFYDRFTYKAKI